MKTERTRRAVARIRASHVIGASVLGLLVPVCSCAARADDIVKVTHQGIERQAVLYQPASVASPAPVVIALHGLGQTTENLRTWLHLDATADWEGFRVLYPEAVDKLWSYGRPIVQPMPKAGDETVDDVGFIRLLIDDLVGRKLADPARIYVVGVSRGGLMAFTLACVFAERMAAVAPLITGMTEYQREDCRPARAVPMMVLAGTADRTQSFGGAQGPLGRLLSVPDTMNYWRQQHGCTGRTARSLPRRYPDDRTQIIMIEWSGCRSPLRLYRVEGGGHQVPSLAGESELMTTRFGLRNRDIETADEIWAFFKDFSR